MGTYLFKFKFNYFSFGITCFMLSDSVSNYYYSFICSKHFDISVIGFIINTYLYNYDQ